MPSKKMSSEERVLEYFRTAPLEAARAMHNAAKSVLGLRTQASDVMTTAAAPKKKQRYWSRAPKAKQQPQEQPRVEQQSA